MPVAPFALSIFDPDVVGRSRAHGVALNSSILSWAKVAASVTEFPEALFRVVVTMSPARANKETDKMTSVIITSSKVNPLDVGACLKVNLQESGWP